MRVIKIIISLLIMTVIISPVIALSPDQEINGVMIGDHNTQDLDNTMIVYDKSQDTSASQIGGSHNTQIVTSTNNEYIGTGGVSYNPVSVTLNIPKPDAQYRGFDIGTINTQIISMYEGDPLIIMNDENYPNMILSKPGDKFRYTIKSSIPVLAYVVNGNDYDKVLYDIDVVPVYDPIAKKYETGNLNILYMSKYRSPQQQFEVTVEDIGRYALVIDSRVSRNIDGRMTKITGNSFDVHFTIEKLNSTPRDETRPPMIGKIDMYPTSYFDGTADTQNTTYST